MLDMELSIRDADGRAVIALRGKLNLAGTPGVTSHLVAAVAACGPSVIVDMAALDSIGDGALPVLLRALQWTRRSGGDLPLAAPQRPVRQVLEAAGLLAVFSVYPSVEQAADSARLAQPWSPEALRQRPAAMATGSGDGQPACRTARHPLVRPLPRHGTCRPRRRSRDIWDKRRPPGGTTAA
jgi:anti-anti-sigma factor